MLKCLIKNKILLSTCVVLLSLCCSSLAQSDACNIIALEQAGSNFSTSVPVGETSGRQHLASLNVAGEFTNSFNCCYIEAFVKAIGSPTQTYYMALYSSTENGDYTTDMPFEVLATSFAGVDSSTLTTNGTWVGFIFDYYIDNTKDYWADLYTDDPVDSANHISWDRTSFGNANAQMEQRQSSNGISWGNQSNSRSGAIKYYEGQNITNNNVICVDSVAILPGSKTVYSNDIIDVSMNVNYSNTSIYYTTNGLTPTTADNLYESPFVVYNLPVNIKAKAFDNDGLAFDSIVSEVNYNLVDGTNTVLISNCWEHPQSDSNGELIGLLEFSTYFISIDVLRGDTNEVELFKVDELGSATIITNINDGTRTYEGAGTLVTYGPTYKTYMTASYDTTYNPTESDRSSGTITVTVVEEPTIDVESLYISDNIMIHLSINEKFQEACYAEGPPIGIKNVILYTLDGSEPTTNSIRYVNSLLIAPNTILKAKGFRSLPGDIISKKSQPSATLVRYFESFPLPTPASPENLRFK